MSWIQYNKPSLICGGLGLVLFLGITGYGVSLYLKKQEMDEQIKTSQNNIESMARKTITPTQKSLKELKELSAQYQAKLDAIKVTCEPFRAASSLAPTTAQAFQDALKSESKQWQEDSKTQGIIVTNEARWMGFEAYPASAPYAHAASILTFEKAGIENFLRIASESGVVKFTRIYRTTLPEEQAKKEGENGDQPARKTRGARGSSAQSSDQAQSDWRYLPFEISFVGDRQSIIKILNQLIESDTYLYTISGMRVHNEKQILPAIKPPKQEEKQSTAGGGLSLAGQETTAPAEPVAPVIEEILTPVMGDEKVSVHMALNLIYFPSAEPTPSQEDASQE